MNGEAKPAARHIAPLEVLYYAAGAVLLTLIVAFDWPLRVPFPLLLGLMVVYAAGGVLLRRRARKIRPARFVLVFLLMATVAMTVGCLLEVLGALPASWAAALLVGPCVALCVWADLASRRAPPELNVDLAVLQRQRNSALVGFVSLAALAGYLFLTRLKLLTAIPPDSGVTPPPALSLLLLGASVLAVGSYVNYRIVVLKIDLLRAKRSEEQEQRQNGEEE